METSILFVGDVMPGRLIADNVKISKDICEYFKSASLRICNFEGVVTQHTPSISIVKRDPMHYLCKHCASPEQCAVVTLLDMNCCSLANNHVLDYGAESVKDTIHFMNKSNIKWFGFGKDWITAWKPRVVKVKFPECPQSNDSSVMSKKFFRMAIFGLADHFVEWKANINQPGINYFNVNEFLQPETNPNRDRMTNIKYIKDQIDKDYLGFNDKDLDCGGLYVITYLGYPNILMDLIIIMDYEGDNNEIRPSVDLLVFSIHWGNNFEESVPSIFQTFAHALIDMGVDIIHGHSTHHVQGVEVYKRSLVMYGCGDFLNDYDLMEEVLQQQNETLGHEYISFRSDLGFIYKVILKPFTESTKISRLELFPINISKGKVSRCTDENKEILFERMFDACKQFNTNIARTVEDVLVIPVT